MFLKLYNLIGKIVKMTLVIILLLILCDVNLLTSTRSLFPSHGIENLVHLTKKMVETDRPLKPVNNLSWHRMFSSVSGESLEYCNRSAKCVPLKNTTCMGIKLPYSHTTLDLVDGLSSQDQAQVIILFSTFIIIQYLS